MKKFVAELIGTFTLVLFGCGAAVLAGAQVGQLGIAFAFGLTITGMAYGIGPISGCHINPAVSFGSFVSGRMPLNEMLLYWAAQFIGAVIAAGVLYMIASGKAGYDLATGGLGQNGYGDHSPGGYTLLSGIVFEVVATFIFLIVIFGSTQKAAPGAVAGMAIGLTLTLIHIAGIQVTGVSVNPARSFGPAVFVGGAALTQLWLFIVAPLIGAGLAGLVLRAGIVEKDEA